MKKLSVLSLYFLLFLAPSIVLAQISEEEQILENGLFPKFGTQLSDFKKTMNRSCIEPLRDGTTVSPSDLASSSNNCLGLDERRVNFYFSRGHNRLFFFTGAALWFDSFNKAEVFLNKIVNLNKDKEFSVRSFYSLENREKNHFLKIYSYLGQQFIFSKENGFYKVSIFLTDEAESWLLRKIYLENHPFEPIQFGSVIVGETLINEIIPEDSCHLIEEKNSTRIYQGKCSGFPFESRVLVEWSKNRVNYVSFGLDLKPYSSHQAKNIEKEMEKAYDIGYSIFNSLKKIYGEPLTPTTIEGISEPIVLNPLTMQESIIFAKTSNESLVEENLVPSIEFYPLGFAGYPFVPSLNITAKTPINPVEPIREVFYKQKEADDLFNQTQKQLQEDERNKANQREKLERFFK